LFYVVNSVPTVLNNSDLDKVSNKENADENTLQELNDKLNSQQTKYEYGWDLPASTSTTSAAKTTAREETER
jgi:hypothetical protein